MSVSSAANVSRPEPDPSSLAHLWVCVGTCTFSGSRCPWIKEDGLVFRGGYAATGDFIKQVHLNPSPTF